MKFAFALCALAVAGPSLATWLAHSELGAIATQALGQERALVLALLGVFGALLWASDAFVESAAGRVLHLRDEAAQ